MCCMLVDFGKHGCASCECQYVYVAHSCLNRCPESWSHMVCSIAFVCCHNAYFQDDPTITALQPELTLKCWFGSSLVPIVVCCLNIYVCFVIVAMLVF